MRRLYGQIKYNYTITQVNLNYFERRVFSQPFALINAHNLVLNTYFNILIVIPFFISEGSSHQPGFVILRKLLLIFIFLAGTLGVAPTASALSFLTINSVSQGTELKQITITYSVASECHNWIIYRDGIEIGSTSINDCNSGIRTFTDNITDLGDHVYTFTDLQTHASTNAVGWPKRAPDATTGVSATRGTQYGKVNVAWSSATLATGVDLFMTYKTMSYKHIIVLS